MVEKTTASVDKFEPISNFSLSKLLVWLAGLLWVVSLVLPGFNDSPGILIALLGLFLGWFAFGWAAYANIFFIVASIQLMKRRLPVISIVVMILLTLTVKLYPTSKNTVMTHESAPPVDSWGWGFYVWLAAQVILTLALLVSIAGLSATSFGITRRVKIEMKMVGAFFSVCVIAALIGIGLYIAEIGNTQYLNANVQDRKQYFNFGTAVVAAPLCNRQLQMVGQSVVPEGALLKTEVEVDISGVPSIRYEEKYGDTWRLYRAKRGELHVPVREPIQYLIKTRKLEDDGAVVQIVDLFGEKILYEQKFSRRGPRKELCPYADTEIRKAIGDTSYNFSPTSSLKNEASLEICNSSLKLGSVPDLFVWDKREVRILNWKTAREFGFCSESYIVTILPEAAPADHAANIQAGRQHFFVNTEIYDRATLKPLRNFQSNWKSCLSNCAEEMSAQVTGFSLNSGTVTVSTSVGPWDIAIK